MTSTEHPTWTEDDARDAWVDRIRNRNEELRAEHQATDEAAGAGEQLTLEVG